MPQGPQNAPFWGFAVSRRMRSSRCPRRCRPAETTSSIFSSRNSQTEETIADKTTQQNRLLPCGLMGSLARGSRACNATRAACKSVCSGMEHPMGRAERGKTRLSTEKRQDALAVLRFPRCEDGAFSCVCCSVLLLRNTTRFSRISISCGVAFQHTSCPPGALLTVIATARCFATLRQ